MNEKTPQEQKEFAGFCHKLDSRNFTIVPQNEKFKGAAIDAKHRAMELLVSMPIGAVIKVVNSEGTMWCQERR